MRVICQEAMLGNHLIFLSQLTTPQLKWNAVDKMDPVQNPELDKIPIGQNPEWTKS